tara:strand:+ start:355 stop:915 length:561 start_codon:yes stop_codon:yes gene_type:complete
MKKWFAITLGTLLGISHIGMIGMVARKDSFPQVNLPVGKYTSYSVQAGKEGYVINYRAHDPKVMATIEKVDRPAGFLGFGKKRAMIETQYMAEGALHVDPIIGEDGNPLSAKQVACIKAQGSGESTGRLVGGGLGTAVVTQTGMASIPIVGWVLAGATTMLGMDQGAEIGGHMSRDLNENCEEDIK